jgi:hypothetical protein
MTPLPGQAVVVTLLATSTRPTTQGVKGSWRNAAPGSIE